MEKNSLHVLTHLGHLYAEGADTDAFLQGQLSNDIQLLTTDRAQLSSYNSPKGRMLAVLHLTRGAEGVLLQMERSILDATLKRLRMFVLRSKVRLTDVSEKIAALGIAGTEAMQILTDTGLSAPSAISACVNRDALSVVRCHGDIPRFIVQGDIADIAELKDKLSARIPVAGADDWRALDILAGVPVVFPQTSDHFVPQMTNLDQLGGISFTKGCYTGQEIVARLHYLGNLKRRMFHCHTEAINVAPGTDVYDAGGEQSVGEVVQSANTHAGSLLSVVLQLNHAHSPSLRLGSPTGPALSKPDEYVLRTNISAAPA
jgi:folate-binding protein YgfZ